MYRVGCTLNGDSLGVIGCETKLVAFKWRILADDGDHNGGNWDKSKPLEDVLSPLAVKEFQRPQTLERASARRVASAQEGQVDIDCGPTDRH